MGACTSTTRYVSTDIQSVSPFAASSVPVPNAPVNSGSLGLPPRVKLVLLGDSGVGKSCLALRFTRGIFDAGSRATVGAAFSSATVTVPGSTASCKLEICLSLGGASAKQGYCGAGALPVSGASLLPGCSRGGHCV
ncbi:hypothetical protein Vafri_14419 [Volvox africanus]|uniref:Uncharacterized protein n=1 Tax=Volvox africanus TaxID=51714 RepID=A0A8J4F4E9_9CHLO|nr:hypothetical protein Vafri_14419 [Volvox africanus]